MHDSSASRFRQRAGSARGSATILRLLPQPPPWFPCPPCSPLPRLPHHHVSSSDRDFLPCKHGTAEPTGGTRGRRASASHQRGILPAPGCPPGSVPGSGPTETPPGSPPRYRRSLRPPVTPWTLQRRALRRSGSGALPSLSPICCEANHCIALSCRRQPKRGRKKKKVSN